MKSIEIVRGAAFVIAGTFSAFCVHKILWPALFPPPADRPLFHTSDTEVVTVTVPPDAGYVLCVGFSTSNVRAFLFREQRDHLNAVGTEICNERL